MSYNLHFTAPTKDDAKAKVRQEAAQQTSYGSRFFEDVVAPHLLGVIDTLVTPAAATETASHILVNAQGHFDGLGGRGEVTVRYVTHAGASPTAT